MVWVLFIDPIEEAEVDWVRGQKKLIKDLLGDKLVEMAASSEWMVAEYQVLALLVNRVGVRKRTYSVCVLMVLVCVQEKTAPMIRDGGVYVSSDAVKKSREKFVMLHSMVQQTLATFEEYYGACR